MGEAKLHTWGFAELVAGYSEFNLLHVGQNRHGDRNHFRERDFDLQNFPTSADLLAFIIGNISSKPEKKYQSESVPQFRVVSRRLPGSAFGTHRGRAWDALQPLDTPCSPSQAATNFQVHRWVDAWASDLDSLPKAERKAKIKKINLVIFDFK